MPLHRNSDSNDLTLLADKKAKAVTLLIINSMTKRRMAAIFTRKGKRVLKKSILISRLVKKFAQQLLRVPYTNLHQTFL